MSSQQSNASVYLYKRYRRKKIALNNSCMICPPRRGENARHRYKHGFNSKYKYKK